MSVTLKRTQQQLYDSLYSVKIIKCRSINSNNSCLAYSASCAAVTTFEAQRKSKDENYWEVLKRLKIYENICKHMKRPENTWKYMKTEWKRNEHSAKISESVDVFAAGSQERVCLEIGNNEIGTTPLTWEGHHKTDEPSWIEITLNYKTSTSTRQASSSLGKPRRIETNWCYTFK